MERIAAVLEWNALVGEDANESFDCLFDARVHQRSGVLMSPIFANALAGP